MPTVFHISDLHLVKDATGDNLNDLLRNEATDRMRAIPKGEKLLIASGDFHNWKETDYDKAKEFILSLVKAMGIDMEQDVFVVPGNHDAGNDATIKACFPGTNVDLFRKVVIEKVKDWKTDQHQRYLEERRKHFELYCRFVRELGIYKEADGDLPVRSHVRCWRNRLNILHLNTALAADGKEKKNQITDIDEAADPEIWKKANEKMPTIAVGHNHILDILGNSEEAQIDFQKKLREIFLVHNVSAYLCGDRHLIPDNPNELWYKLGDYRGETNVEIPVCCCAKTSGDNGDTYSEFGYWILAWKSRENQAKRTCYKLNKTFFKTNPDLSSEFQLRGVHRAEKTKRERTGDADGGIETTLTEILDQLEGRKDCGQLPKAGEYRKIQECIAFLESKREQLIDYLSAFQIKYRKEDNDAGYLLWLRASESDGTGEPVMPLLYAELLLRAAAYEIDCQQSSSIIVTNLDKAEKTLRAHMEFTPAQSLGTEEAALLQRLLDRLDTLRKSFKAWITAQKKASPTPPLRADAGKPNAAAMEWKDQIGFFPALYSQEFDSAPGADEQNMERMEIAMMRSLISCKTVVLQGPQISDNGNMLRLLLTDGFRKLWEEGYVVYTPFRDLISPLDYLKDRLARKDFHFSSFKGFNEKEVGAKEAEANRRVIQKALESSSMPAFHSIRNQLFIPPEMKAESFEEIYEAYRRLADMQAATRYYSPAFHQDWERRKTASNIRFWRVQKDDPTQWPSIPDAIGFYLNELEKDIEAKPDPARERHCRGLRAMLETVRERTKQDKDKGVQTEIRGYFYGLLSELQGTAYAADSPDLLESFRELVDLAYNLRMGVLSSNAITVHLQDNRLLLHNRYHPAKPQAMYGIDYILKLYKKETDPGMMLLHWKDFIYALRHRRETEIARIVEHWPEEKSLEEKNKDGIVTVNCYTDSQDQAYEVTGFSCETTAGGIGNKKTITSGESESENTESLGTIVTINDETALT